MHTFYFHTLDTAKAFADLLCINFRSGSTATVRPTTPFDGWYMVQLINPTAARMEGARQLWLENELWPKAATASGIL